MTDGPVLRVLHAERELQREVTLRKAKSFTEGIDVGFGVSFCWERLKFSVS